MRIVCEVPIGHASGGEKTSGHWKMVLNASVHNKRVRKLGYTQVCGD